MADRPPVAPRGDHVVRFGRPPTAISYRLDSTLRAMQKSSSVASAVQGAPVRCCGTRKQTQQEGAGMDIQRFHGVDLHRRYAAISVRDRSAEQTEFHARVLDFGAYVRGLGPEDAVVLEASSGVFFWADLIRRQGARCMIIDPLAGVRPGALAANGGAPLCGGRREAAFSGGAGVRARQPGFRRARQHHGGNDASGRPSVLATPAADALPATGSGETPGKDSAAGRRAGAGREMSPWKRRTCSNGDGI